MPTYQYVCKNCGHELEEFQSITEPPLVRCPNCKTDNLIRTIGTGGGVIFKGSGFYLTDYKKESKETKKTTEKKESKKEEKKETKPETSDKKPEPKSPGTTGKKE